MAPYGDVLGDTYRDHIEMVSICDGMKTFQMRLVPGLLRTHAYGRAVIVASHAWQRAEEDDQFVQGAYGP